MTSIDLTPARLAIRLFLYFFVLFGTVILVVTVWPDTMQNFPLGGHDALDFYETQEESLKPPDSASKDELKVGTTTALHLTSDDVATSVLFLSLHLSGTILLMIPISWTYMASRQDIGFEKNFARALIVLPICATTIVLLIQDSLALAFGLAALVAAVRFRVELQEAVDGVYVFAAICVGLAAGIGYLGIASIMTVFFCFASVVLWQIEYGENPFDQARQEKRRAKLTLGDQESSS